MKNVHKVMLAQLCLWLFLLEPSLCVDLIYYVEEGMSPGTYIGDIAADTQFADSFPHQDRNLITFSQLHVNLNGNNHLFNVTEVGKLYTAQILDTESLCKYKAKCCKMVEVAVQHKLSFFKILEIKIVIEDINDYSPMFPNKEIHLQFSETDGKGTTKSIPHAVDRDYGISNSKISYRLDKSVSDPFILSVSKKVDGTSKLGIILKEKLDREQKNNYSIRVIANDGGSPSKQGILKVLIDIKDENDNSPIFTQNIYNVTIDNQHQKNIAILTLSAKDLDYGKNGQITYHFSSETSELAKSYFKLNEQTGEIFLWENFSFERGQKYKLFIEATDSGVPPLSSTTIVLINVINQQNNAPQIEMKFVSQPKGNKVTISEGVKVGSFIAYVKVADSDSGHNGEVTCSLHHFKLQLQSLGKNKYKVVIKNQVNRETESHINFTIVCEDQGSPSLETTKIFSIQVTDVNDMQPKFMKDTFKFLTYENEKPNFPIGFIKVTDPDLGAGGQLSYFLFSNKVNMLPFKISNFGFISTTQSLDREKQDIYELQVIVKDNGSPSLNNTAKVIVEVMDENDNAPYFTFPSVSPFRLDIYYQPKSTHDITTLRASDRDSHVNAFLRYEIQGGNDKQLFTVNPYTGVMSFSRPVYQNDAGSYDLQLVVKDGGIPVLSATTYLSLILTVSNKTSKMFTAIDTQSDDKIHLNLVIIIVVAAVIISIAIVVSMAICIIHKKNRRNVQYHGGVNDSNKFLDQRIQSGYVCEQISPQYDAPVTMVTDLANTRNSQSTLPRREPQSGYESGHSWKVSNSGIHLQDITEWTHQSSVTSGVGKKDKTVTVPERISELSAISSCADSGHGLSEGDTGHYEELPGFKPYKPKKLHTTGSMSLPQILNKATESKTTGGGCFDQNDAGQNSHCNDVIDLKSIRVNTSSSTIPTQLWNLPSRNSFTSYAKPLPAVPKILPNS